MKKKSVRYCNQPDRDFPKMKCGFPLPCPWHTVIIEKGVVTNPEILNKMDKGTREKVNDIADVLKDL